MVGGLYLTIEGKEKRQDPDHKSCIQQEIRQQLTHMPCTERVRRFNLAASKTLCQGDLDSLAMNTSGVAEDSLYVCHSKEVCLFLLK